MLRFFLLTFCFCLIACGVRVSDAFDDANGDTASLGGGAPGTTGDGASDSPKSTEASSAGGSASSVSPSGSGGASEGGASASTSASGGGSIGATSSSAGAGGGGDCLACPDALNSPSDPNGATCADALPLVAAVVDCANNHCADVCGSGPLGSDAPPACASCLSSACAPELDACS